MKTAISLIDKLISSWSEWESHQDYYLNVLIPCIVTSECLVTLTPEEKKIVADLRALLSKEEWKQLPFIVAERRAGILKELASDLERAESWLQAKREAEDDLARQRKEEERRQRAIRHELEKQERERRRAEEALHVRRHALHKRICKAFECDFLSADVTYSSDPDANLINQPEYEELKANFVSDWTKRELNLPLDNEQAAAIASAGGDILVIARAGSGKTRTLVTRAIFLQKHCGITPGEILLLTFNRTAADEMKERLAKALGNNMPHVMTFHALAHAIVHPEEDILFDDGSADQLRLSREIQKVIDTHINDKDYGNRIRDLMLAHFREDWERIVEGRFQLTMEEFLEYRRNLPRESLKGDYVKSFGERIIANTLFEHEIEYKYERNFRWDGVNYRPDFTIFTGQNRGIVIEYFGLLGQSDYDTMAGQKREFWKDKAEWVLLELSPNDLLEKGERGFEEALLEELDQLGVSYQRLSDVEIWQRVEQRAIDRFTKTMKSFIGRCRKENLSLGDLRSRIAKHTPCSDAERLFLEVSVPIYDGYLHHIKEYGQDDFSGLIWRSIENIRAGDSCFVRDKGKEKGDVSKIRFGLIDEFQDFSLMFSELVKAIRSVNPDVQYYCVGDDWQAINAFAGSDLRFFMNFDQYFHKTMQCQISTNYRSPASVVATGNALMEGIGFEATPNRTEEGQVFLCKINEFTPSAVEQARHCGDRITPSLLRLIKFYLDRGLNIVMLSRRNRISWYVKYDETIDETIYPLLRFRDHIRSYLPVENRDRVEISTTHKYKGLEQPAVIVLDAVSRSYPLIHPNWVFLRIFGDTLDKIEAEERRLFYVAITRATDSLAILTENRQESPYISELERTEDLTALSWSRLKPMPSLDGSRLEIRVFEAYEIREQLKNLKYRWNDKERYWYKSELEAGFNSNELLAQPWVEEGIRIQVWSESGELLHQR